MAAGTLHSKGTLLFRIDAGTATSSDGTTYELAIDARSCPIIRSTMSGRFWSIGWDELLKLATAAGIDKDDD